MAQTSDWIEIGDHRVRHLRDGACAFPSMLQAIASADREILLEIYWWGNDAAGQRFRQALMDRALAGVRVRVIFDGLGSWSLDDEFQRGLREAGVELLEYHPVSPLSHRFRIDRVWKRDHRKILVVDGATGFTGGINLAVEWAPQDWGGDNWRDDMIEVRGPCVQELRTIFYDTWRRCGARPPTDLCRLQREPKADVWVLANHRALGVRRHIRRFYVSKIGRGQREIDIANPYFVPDRTVRKALLAAVKRGVRVRLLLPAKCDVWLVQLAMEHMSHRLCASGIQVWLYEERVMHSKLAIIDGSFVTVGSYNLDRLSLRYNLECNVAVVDERLVQVVRASFESDLRAATALRDSAWCRRSFWRRVLGWLAFQIRAFL